MRVKIDIETKTFVRFLLVVSGFVGVVILVWKLWPALMIIGISAFLALALNPSVSIIGRRLPGHSRVLATALAYLMVLAIVGVFIYIALPPIIDQTSRFISALPQYIQDLSSRRGVVSDFINRYGLQEQINQLVSGAQQQSGGLAQGLGSSLVNGVSSIFTGAITLITVLVLTFLMLIEGPIWMNKLWDMYHNKVKLESHKRIAERMYKVMSSYVNGQVFVAGIAAASGLLTLLVLTYFFQLPVTAVIPLTGIIFVTDLIPMIGATIGAIIVSIVLLFNDVGAAISFAIYFIIYQQIENNFIQPVVQSRTVALSALSVLSAVIIGINLLGLIGGIVAIPIAGCIRVIILEFLETRRLQRKKHESRAKLVKAAAE